MIKHYKSDVDGEVLYVYLTHIPGGGAHHRLQLELGLQLGGGGEVEYPVVVDESHQGPGLDKYLGSQSQNKGQNLPLPARQGR